MNWLKRLLEWPGRIWRRSQRAIDRKILWPEFERQAESKAHAEAGKLIHIGIDSAWRYADEWRAEEPRLFALLMALKPIK
jgi:hypothetical protein